MANDVQDLVPVGEVVKAVGLKGEIKLYPLLDFHAPLLESGHLVWQDGRPAGIAGFRPSGSCVVLKVEGVTDRDAAEAAVGRILGFRRASYALPDFARPAGGLPFRFLERRVVTGAGDPVGTVVEVRWTGGQHLLVVAAGGREILIPAVVPIVEIDDRTEGDIVVHPPEGLLDVQD